MKLIDLNRQHRIGASGLLLEMGTHRVLIDSGMDPKDVGFMATPDFNLLGDGPLDLILLTHCHLDHLGSLPIAFRQHPEATVLCSRPSAMLAARMLRNSINVMKRQREELSISEYPLYSKGEVRDLDEALLPMPYGMTKAFGLDEQDLEVTFYPAGHVAGAAGIKLQYKRQKIFITGDVLFTDQLTLPGARFPEEDFDIVITETTRGRSERHPETTRQNEAERFIHTLRDTLQNGGSVLIPVFALGRMQEVLVMLKEARDRGELPECPVICSGLGVDLVDFFDTISRKTGALKFQRKVMRELGAKTLDRITSPGKDLPKKGIYLLSSGMLVEHTPSYMAASCLLEHNSNAICFVGYCDPETPGGRLLKTPQGDSFVFDVLDYVCNVRAAIEQFDLSGHADREELLDYAVARNPRTIVLTHGDPEARRWFDEELAIREPKINVIDSLPGHTYEL